MRPTICPSTPTIRPLTPADIPAYTALRREMLTESPWAFSSSPEDDMALQPGALEARINEPFHAIIGAFDDAPAGEHLFGAAGIYRARHHKMAHRAHIWGVYIAPARRGQGIGRPLLAAAIDTARTWPGITSIALSCSAQSAAALRLYQRLGFQQWGREPAALIWNGRGYDEIHMLLHLEPPASLSDL